VISGKARQGLEMRMGKIGLEGATPMKLAGDTLLGDTAAGLLWMGAGKWMLLYRIACVQVQIALPRISTRLHETFTLIAGDCRSG